MAKSKKSNGEAKARKPRGPVVRIDNEQFVRYWVAGKSGTELAEIFGASISCVRAKAMTLRKKGVNLPRQTGSRLSNVDIAHLNAIIAGEDDGYVQESLPGVEGEVAEYEA